MELIRVHSLVERDGEVRMTGLPFHKGDDVEVVLLSNGRQQEAEKPLTAAGLLRSGLVGVWKHRSDLGESPAFARCLRDRAQLRK